jgi:tetratricopeptide (TPR) repeat protein
MRSSNLGNVESEAFILILQGKYEETNQMLSTFCIADRTSARVGVARRCMMKDKWDDALRCLDACEKNSESCLLEGKCLRAKGHLKEAYKFGSRCIEMSREVGDFGNDFVSASCFVGEVLIEVGDFPNAMKIYRGAEAYLKESPMVNDGLQSVLTHLGKADKKKFTELCVLYHGLSVSYSAKGDLRQAVYYRLEDLRLTVEMYGTNHTEYATSINNLGLIMYKLKRFWKSVSLFEEALCIRKAQLGDANSSTNLSAEYLEMAKIGLRYGRGRSGIVSATLFQCEFCEDISSSKLLCSACKRVFYCGSKCQTTHWQTHKAQCIEGKNMVVTIAFPYEMQASKELFMQYGLGLQKQLMTNYLKNNGVLKKQIVTLTDELVGCLFEGEDCKLMGNEAFKERDFNKALKFYNKALDAFEGYVKKNGSFVGCPVVFVERGGNMSACCFELEDFKNAITMCTYALELIDDYAKIRLRRALSYEKLEMLMESLTDYRLYLDLVPGDGAIIQVIQRIRSALCDKVFQVCGDYACETCGKAALLRCSGCFGVRYCSAECQLQHWERHKLSCTASMKLRQDEKAGLILVSTSQSAGIYLILHEQMDRGILVKKKKQYFVACETAIACVGRTS